MQSKIHIQSYSIFLEFIFNPQISNSVLNFYVQSSTYVQSSIFKNMDFRKIHILAVKIALLISNKIA